MNVFSIEGNIFIPFFDAIAYVADKTSCYMLITREIVQLVNHYHLHFPAPLHLH